MPHPLKRVGSSARYLNTTLPALRGKLADPSPALADLWRRYAATGDVAAFHALCEHYAPLALIMAVRCKRGRPDFYADPLDDLVSDGLLGLIRAIRKTGRAGEGFVTFARYQIKATISASVKSRTWAGKSRHDRITMIARLRAELVAEHARPPTRAELTAALAAHITNPRIMVGDVEPPEVGPLTAAAAQVPDRRRRTPLDEAVDRERGGFRQDVLRLAYLGLSRDERRMLRLTLAGRGTRDVARLLGVAQSSAATRVRGLLWELRCRTDLADALGVERQPRPPVRTDGFRRKVLPPIGAVPPARLVG